MTSRFQSIEQTLSWFSPCVLFCAAPVVVTIVVYTLVRFMKRRSGTDGATMYDPETEPKIERVETKKVKFERESDEKRG